METIEFNSRNDPLAGTFLSDAINGRHQHAIEQRIGIDQQKEN